MVAVSFSGEVIAVYEVIAEPPFFAGAVNATEIEVEEILVAVPIVGAPGTVAAIDAVVLLFADVELIEFVAVTVQVIVFPASAATKVYVLLVALLILDPARFH